MTASWQPKSAEVVTSMATQSEEVQAVLEVDKDLTVEVRL